MGEGGKRLYVGNLYPEVTQDELKERFNKFGSVSGVEIKHKKDIDGRPTQTFGFIDMVMTDANLNNCITTLSNTKWKGYMLRIQQAKESFMSRLARERAEKEKSASGAPYDPLSLVKSKQEAEGIESKPEKKIVSKHLGGDRSESDRRGSAASGNYTRLGKRTFGEDDNGGRDNSTSTESKSFLPQRSSNYDPFSMIRKHTGKEDEEPENEPVAAVVPVDEGTVVDGVVSFEDKDVRDMSKEAKRRKKVYHSSDEDDQTNKQPKQEVVKKVKKKETKEERAKTKEKLRLRFEARQQETKEKEEKEKEEKEKGAAKQPKQNQDDSKYYGSSDEEEEEDEKEEPTPKTDIVPAAGKNIMKKFKSFSSSVWADSDQEEEEEDDADEDDEGDAEDEEDEDMDVDGERDRNYQILSSVVGKPVAKVESRPKPQPIDYMPRFDPDAADDAEDLVEDDDGEEEEQDENDKTEAASPVVVAKTDTTVKLKEAFGVTKSFSFGFRGAEPETATKPMEIKPELFRLDSDDETEKPPPADFSQKFGSQLKATANENVEPFFFGADDDRIVASINFFFTDRPDLEKERAEFGAKRPELAAIFKKKARSKAQLMRVTAKTNYQQRSKGRRRQKGRVPPKKK